MSVPYCKDCENINCDDTCFKTFYCYQENEDKNIIGNYKFLGVDYPPKISPIWCPKRPDVENVKLEILEEE
jgi:hypothetical protein